jgi:hypothetical protein
MDEQKRASFSAAPLAIPPNGTVRPIGGLSAV